MARSPFILCTRKLKDGTFWYARFYDPENQTRYLVRSTGVPYTEKKGNNRIKANAVAEKILETLYSNQQDPLFLEYVLSFWSEDSQYLKKKILADKKPLSSYYVKMNQEGIKKYVCSYKRFYQLKISRLTTAMIDDWKLCCLEKNVGSRRVNAVLQSIRIPIRYLYERREIQVNPFDHVKPVKDCPKEKGILTVDEFSALLAIEEEDREIILAIRLAALCGMRRGEVRGIQWQDIDFEKNQIHICHNYIDSEGVKPCKWDSKRSHCCPR
jgi:integrase